jgi:hypothetical protein
MAVISVSSDFRVSSWEQRKQMLTVCGTPGSNGSYASGLGQVPKHACCPRCAAPARTPRTSLVWRCMVQARTLFAARCMPASGCGSHSPVTLGRQINPSPCLKIIFTLFVLPLGKSHAHPLPAHPTARPHAARIYQCSMEAVRRAQPWGVACVSRKAALGPIGPWPDPRVISWPERVIIHCGTCQTLVSC